MKGVPSILLTGGIGSGKSAVSRLLANHGGAVYDSDSMAKSLYERVPGLVGRLEEALGRPLRGADGAFSRGLLAAAIFGPDSGEDRKKVEEIVHPAVFEDYREWRQSLPEVPFTVFESAIVLKTGYPEMIADYVIFVDAPLEVRIERVMERDGASREAALARISAQDGVDPGDPRIDFIVDNGGDLESLSEKIEILIEKIR
ncbi:MAG: dephospho-CoA kinase [Bacteroidales bacterium]|nr:dephospho-CoA kinase [Bacteroidales bacterium]